MDFLCSSLWNFQLAGKKRHTGITLLIQNIWSCSWWVTHQKFVNNLQIHLSNNIQVKYPHFGVKYSAFLPSAQLAMPNTNNFEMYSCKVFLLHYLASLFTERKCHVTLYFLYCEHAKWENTSGFSFLWTQDFQAFSLLEEQACKPKRKKPIN